jgi:hypothetical protein
VARAAAEVDDRPGTGALHEFGESGEQRTVPRLGRQFAAEALGVVGGHGVVGRPGSAQKGRFRHGRES